MIPLPTDIKVLNSLIRHNTMPVLALAADTGVPLSTLLTILSRFETEGLLRWRKKDSRSAGLVTATSRANSARYRVIYSTKDEKAPA